MFNLPGPVLTAGNATRRAPVWWEGMQTGGYNLGSPQTQSINPFREAFWNQQQQARTGVGGMPGRIPMGAYAGRSSGTGAFMGQQPVRPPTGMDRQKFLESAQKAGWTMGGDGMLYPPGMMPPPQQPNFGGYAISLA